MNSNIVYQGQSFLDKTLELTGSIENAFEMALLNGISITDDLEIGQSLKGTEITDANITNLFTPANRPATAISLINKEDNDGINYMEIENDFIVQ